MTDSSWDGKAQRPFAPRDPNDRVVTRGLVGDPRDRPRVLRIYSRLEVGGIEQQLLRILPRLAGGRYDVSLCLLRRPGALTEALRAAGVPVHVLPLKGRLSPRSLLRLARLMRQERVSIVHAHVRESNATATAAALLAGVPVVIASVHNVLTIHGRRRIVQERVLDRWRDAVMAVSDRVKEDYCSTVGVDPAKCVTIYNGIDLEAFGAGGPTRLEVRSALGLEAVDRVVITVSRLVPQKAHEVLLEAAEAVTRAVPRARFLVVGEGPRLDELKARARTRGLASAVMFLGNRTDVRDLYRASDVSCLTSNLEGFSNFIVESLASGLPVVATDVGGNREAIEDRVSGFLLPPGDAAGIGQRLTELLTDESLRARLGAEALARASRFSLEETARATEALYDRLLAAKGIGVAVR